MSHTVRIQVLPRASAVCIVIAFSAITSSTALSFSDEPIVELHGVEHVLRTPLLGEVHRSTRDIVDARRFDFDGGQGVLWGEIDADGGRTPYYAISQNARGIDRVTATSHQLLLRYAAFDPLDGEPIIPPSLRVPAGRLHIIQFHTQPLEAYRSALEALGVEVHKYLAHNAFIAGAAPESLEAVAALSFVRWVGAYRPAYRLSEEALADVSSGVGVAAQRYNIQVARRGLEQKLAVAERILAEGGQIDALIPDGFLLEATLLPDQLASIAAADQVLFIDRWHAPQTFMDLVRVDGGANAIEAAGGYTGQGVRAEIMDTGLLTTHPSFAALPPLIHNGNNFDNDHGTHVYGINFSDGTGGVNGRGLLPDGQGIFASFYNLTNRYQHTAELLGAPWFAVYQSNSWGACCTTAYGPEAMQVDDIAFINDFLLLQAQANNLSRVSANEAWAKNIISVGGIRHLNTLDRGDDVWDTGVGHGGSIGPAADGRVKPDLCYWYDRIRSTDNAGGISNFGGTSAATPTAAGHFGLMFQMWNDGLFGNAVNPNGTVFENRPHTATARAIMINTAEAYAFSGTNHDLTRMHQGWGTPNVANLYNTRDSILVVDEADVLSNLTSTVYELEVAPDTPRLRATLVYADPPGTTSSTQHRINDLTLRVVSPSQVVYYGNNGLLAGNESTPGGQPNTIDTVENVWLTDPEPGTWAIEVRADEINEDAHLETPEMDADYALVVSGVVVATCGFDSADVNCDGSIDAFDIEPFVCMLVDPNCVACSPCAADVNGDGAVDAFDIEPFVAALIP
jgi:hypothetical protein